MGTFIGWCIKLSVQTFQPLNVIYRRVNIVYYYWGYTSIYMLLSYPFTFLTMHILKYETLFSDLDNLCASSFFDVRLLILSGVATLQFKRFSSVCFLNYLIPLIFSTLISNSKIAPYPLCASSFESQNIIFKSTIKTSFYHPRHKF